MGNRFHPVVLHGAQDDGDNKSAHSGFFYTTLSIIRYLGKPQKKSSFVMTGPLRPNLPPSNLMDVGMFEKKVSK